MTNILYIHGYGGSAESRTAKSLKKYLPENFNVVTHSFRNDLGNFSTMEENIKTAKQLVSSKNIRIIIASSMGAFVAMNIHGIIKILINPCMLPSEQIPLRLDPSITAEEIQKYKDFENSMDIDIEERMCTYGLFATNDELFTYRNRFDKLYRKEYAYTMNDGHRISEQNVKNKLLALINLAIEETAYNANMFELRDAYNILEDKVEEKYLSAEIIEWNKNRLNE